MQTALIVAVPEAEAAVSHHRSTLDSAAALGVPAHITVLYPFLPLDLITAAVLVRLSRLFTAYPPIGFTLSQTAWFGQEVVYLEPEPATPFRELTAAVWQAFPGYPPYGGVYDDVIPHLTIGHDHPLPVLAAAAKAVTAHLPVTAMATHVRLIGRESPGTDWLALCEFPLGTT